jgi:hypothetical protein
MGQPVSGSTITSVANLHDVATRGFLVLSSEPTTVHTWSCKGHLRHHQTSSVFMVGTPRRTSFQHRGYTVTLLLRGQECWWDIQHPSPAPLDECHPEVLCTTVGFWLEFKIVTDAAILDMFHFPTVSDRHETMEADMFYATRYVLPSDAPEDWYHHAKRKEYAQTMDLDLGPGEAHDVTVTILIEEKTRPSLVCSDAMFVSPSDMYQPMVVSWSSQTRSRSDDPLPGAP